LGGCSLLPADNVWHARVDNLPVHPLSSAYVASLGAANPAHPDFGESEDNGIPYNLVPGNSTPPANVSVLWPFTSDPGPYPIPATAVAEDPSDAGPSGGDQHLIVLDTNNCILYEAFYAILNSPAADSWSVDSISKFTLSSDALKPANWSSSNSAGTTYLPGLIRYDEVAAGHIDHAIAMTATGLSNTYVWPASRAGTSQAGAQYAPMGTRFRLKESVNTSGFSPANKIILEALKTYGAIVVDNGASWFLVGVPDARWNDSDLHNITQLTGSDFEAVDESSLEVSSSSGQVVPGPIPTGWVNIVNKFSGKCIQAPSGIGVVIQSTCNGGSGQKFQFLPEAGGWDGQWLSANGNGYMITPASGSPIEVPWALNQLGISMWTYPFVDSANWIWKPVSVGNGYFYIESLCNNLVLDNTLQTGYSDGSVIQQWAYWGGANQLWQIVPATN
jgi:hypothetical protein